jgi:hypothetical protein
MTGLNERKDKLNFTDFIAILWNFLSLDAGLLSSLIYYLFDDDHSDSLDFSEIKTIVESIHQKKYDTNASIRAMIDVMQYSYAQVSQVQFVRFCKSNHNICAPVVSTQFNLRKQVQGDIFWNNICNKRMTKRQMNKPEFVYKCLENCEMLRASLNRDKRLAQFQEMKKTMLSQKKSQTEIDKASRQSKYARAKGGDGSDKEVLKDKETTATDDKDNNVVNNNKDKPEKVFSSKLKKSISTKMMAVKGFKDGIKIAPNGDDDMIGGGNGNANGIIKRRMSRVASISDSDDNNNDRGKLLRRSSSRKLMINSDESGGGDVGKLKRRSSSKKLIVNSDDDKVVEKLKRSHSRKLVTANDSDGDGGGVGGGVGKLNRGITSSRKLKIESDDDGGNGGGGGVRGKMKRSHSKKSITNDSDDNNSGGGGGGGGGGVGKLKRSSSSRSRKSVALVPDDGGGGGGGDGRRKLELAPLQKKPNKSKSSTTKRKHNT